MKHSYLSYKDNFDDATKLSVNHMLTFMREILCYNKTDSYEYLIKWLSNMVKGNKNNSCLYLKSAVQGIGKSTLQIFMKDFVIGNALCLETGSEPLKNKFNSILEGKLLVSFEELENFSMGEWSAVSSVLKRHITSNEISIERKGINPYTTKNINNYILISNNDAIKDDNGRRYFILDISTKREKDTVYWNHLYGRCFNDLVGQAFYSYLLEVDTDGFNPQDFPLTNSKLDSIAKRLDSVYKFLKEAFILKNKGINKILLGDLYDDYVVFCKENSLGKPLSKIDFNQKLKEAKIEAYRCNGKLKFDVALEKLLEVAKTRSWIHELDEFEGDEKPDELEPNQEVIQLKEENNLLKQEIENLKKLLSEKSADHITIEEESLFEGVSIDDITIDDEDVAIEEDDDIPDDMKRDYDLNEFNKNILSQLL
jgi:phage/plasmid-associated DNA primase